MGMSTKSHSFILVLNTGLVLANAQYDYDHIFVPKAAVEIITRLYLRTMGAKDAVSVDPLSISPSLLAKLPRETSL
jgi:hypothetical protein